MDENSDYSYYNKVLDEISKNLILRNKIKIEYGKKVTVDDLTKETTVITGLFSSGLIVTTSSINRWVRAHPENEEMCRFRTNYIQMLLLRHFSGDWGIMGLEDRLANEAALVNGDRILSFYEYPDVSKGVTDKIWIITEWDRSATTVLFPDDY